MFNFRIRQEKLQRDLNDAANESAGFIKRSIECIFLSIPSHLMLNSEHTVSE